MHYLVYNSTMYPQSQRSYHAHPGTTLFVGVLLFFLTLSALYSVGLVPDYVDGTGGFGKENASAAPTFALPDEHQQLALADIPRLGDEVVVRPVSVLEEAARALREEGMRTAIDETELVPTVPEVPFLPTRIVIEDVSITLPVLNPESTEVAALDAALHDGVVRYPLSAHMNEAGNIFIFGHSSHLPVVKNQMYKAFNGIEELQTGDTIKLEGANAGSVETHLYRVVSVRKTNTEEALIDLSNNGTRRLTLSTCDSFGGKSSRWVVEAEFVGEL